MSFVLDTMLNVRQTALHPFYIKLILIRDTENLSSWGNFRHFFCFLYRNPYRINFFIATPFDRGGNTDHVSAYLCRITHMAPISNFICHRVTPWSGQCAPSAVGADARVLLPVQSGTFEGCPFFLVRNSFFFVSRISNTFRTERP